MVVCMFYTCLCQLQRLARDVNIVFFHMFIKERAIVSTLWHLMEFNSKWRDNMLGKHLQMKVKWLSIPHRLTEHVKAVKATQTQSDTCKIGNVTDRFSSWRYDRSGWRARLLNHLSNDRWWLLQITIPANFKAMRKGMFEEGCTTWDCIFYRPRLSNQSKR